MLFLPLWSGGHQCMELILCRVVVSSCLPNSQYRSTHFFAWPTMSYDHEEIRICWRNGKFLQISPQKFAIQTWFCNCPQYLGLLHIDVECSSSIHDQGKMLVLPNQLLYWVLFPHRINIVFLSSQFFCHPHTQIRIILFHDEQRDIPNLEFSPIHVSIGLSQIAFPIIVLPKDDHINFVQEERLGLPYWTMILAICVVVDESKCLDTPILEFSIICEHLPFLPGCKPILRLLLVHRNLANLEMIACVLRAPHRLITVRLLRRTPGRTPFHPRQTFFWWKSLFLGPIRFPQHLFSVHDHGRQRSGRGPQPLTCPYVGLTVHWPVSVRRSMTGPVTQSIATPEPSSRTIPHSRSDAGRPLEPWVCRHTREPTVLSRLSCRPPHLNFDRFSPALPCSPRRTSRVGEDCRPRTTWAGHLPLRAAQLFLLCVSLEVFATPTRRYHGRMLIHPSLPCMCPPPAAKVIAHTQVRDPRESAAACYGHALGDPISLAIHDLSCSHLRCWKNLAQWILHKNRNCLSQLSPRRTTRPLYFWCFASNSAFFRWQMSINDAKWTVIARCPCFIDHLFLTSDFCQIPRRNFLQFSHSLSTAAFAAGIFIAWDRGINLCTKL